MKKFKGTVNGQSFDNEKDFNEAADKAIKENDGNLSISSYYSYENEDENNGQEEKLPETKKEDEKVKGNPVDESEYVLVNQKPFVNVEGEYEYSISCALEDKLLVASNKDEIKKKCNNLKSWLGDALKKDTERTKELQVEIERLQDELYEKEEGIKKMRASKRYYNTVIDILNETPENEKPTTIKRNGYLPMVLGIRDIFDDFFKF